MVSEEVRENIPRSFSLSKGVATRIETSVPIRGSCPWACRGSSRTGPAISTPFASSPIPTGGLSFMVCSYLLALCDRSRWYAYSSAAHRSPFPLALLGVAEALAEWLCVSRYRGIGQAPSSDPAPRRSLLGSSHAPSFPGEPPLLPAGSLRGIGARPRIHPIRTTRSPLSLLTKGH